jgi:2-oxoisovalerate dehydrogenase E1 component
MEIGKAKLASEGNSVTIVTYGLGVHWALDAKEETGMDLEIIDLCTLLPLDTEAIYSSVRKTGKALILHEDCLFGGLGGEIAALINEHCFESLDAPVMRVGSMDTPVPFAAQLEEQFLPQSRFMETLSKLYSY